MVVREPERSVRWYVSTGSAETPRSCRPASDDWRSILVVVLFWDVVFIRLDQLSQFGAGHGLVFDGALLGNEVDDLVLEHRCTKPGQSLGVLAIEVVNLLFLALEATNLGDQRLLVLFLGDLDVVLVADFGNHQAKAHTALGNGAILGTGGFLGRAFVFERAAVAFDFVLDALPDGLELGVDQLGGTSNL